MYQGVLPSSCFEYLNKAASLQIYNWQHAGAELAISTAHVEGCKAGPRALLHALCHYTLQAKMILVDFNLAVSTRLPTAKFNSLSNFLAIWYFCLTNGEIITVIHMDMKLGLCQCPN